MKIELDVMNVLSLPVLLPQKGTIIEQTIVKDITKKTNLTQEEIVKVGLKPTQTGMQWKDKEYKKIVELTVPEIRLLQKQVDEFDKKGEITQSTLNLCNKIKDIEINPEETKVVK